MRTKLRKGLFVVGLTIVASMALKEPSNVSANQEDAFEIVWNGASLKGDEGNYNWFVEGSTLKIQGTGEMGDFLDHTDNNPPWYDYRKEITQVEISEGITTIGRGAFYEFENLKEISIPDSVTIIDNVAFSYSGLTKVTIPDNVVSIGEQAFYENDNLTEIEFGENVESIGNRAFSRTGLEKVELPEKLTIVESGLFEMCEDLEQVIFNDGLKEIKDYAFYHTILQSADLPNTVESIGMNAFDSTKLYSLKTPQNLKRIDDNAFIACDNLSTVTLNEGLEYLGIYSFKFCPITTITLPASLEEYFQVFEGCDKLEHIYVSKSNPIFYSQDGALFRYEDNQLEFYPLGKTNTSYNIPEGTEVLGYRCFEDANPYLKEIIIPKSVKSIEEGVFQFLPSNTVVYYKGTETEWKKISIANWGLGNGNISEKIQFLRNEETDPDQKETNDVFGKVESNTENSITISGNTYIFNNSTGLYRIKPNEYKGQYVILRDVDKNNEFDKVIERPEKKHGKFESWDGENNIAVIDGAEYQLSSSADMSFLPIISEIIGKQIEFYVAEDKPEESVFVYKIVYCDTQGGTLLSVEKNDENILVQILQDETHEIQTYPATSTLYEELMNYIDKTVIYII